MVYVTGDLHGEYARFSDPTFRRLKKGDTLIVCGDFGFLWKGGKKEEALLRKIGKKRYTVLFLDGRHENFELLNAYPVTDWNGGKAQVISGNLIHLLRGELYTLEGESYFTFGGGESPFGRQLPHVQFIDHRRITPCGMRNMCRFVHFYPIQTAKIGKFGNIRNILLFDPSRGGLSEKK